MNRLKELREQRCFTQDRLAQEIGTSQQTISRIEAGKALIPMDLAINASQYFNISVDYLLGLTNERHNQVIRNRLQHCIINYEEIIEDLASLCPEYQSTVHLMIKTLKAEQERTHSALTWEETTTIP